MTSQERTYLEALDSHVRVRIGPRNQPPERISRKTAEMLEAKGWISIGPEDRKDSQRIYLTTEGALVLRES